jgi:alkanesulfonate monooxygenase SsuD/methylene tetrahydromethanopterin reductase-like flavin-dependent oxidoreductase (luciferase family)
MRFTLDLSHHPWARDSAGRAVAHTLAMAQAADAGGIDAIWANEDPEGWDAFALLGAVAAVTTRAALGTSVTSPYPRHPNLLAASVATLDRLSAGRAVLGLGRGQPEWHRDALGIETGEPLTVLRETIALLRAWWHPPHQASSPPRGHFEVRNWERVIHPQRERVPILLAAAGPRALDLAGSVCDGVIFNLLSSEAFLRQAIPRVRGAAVAAGRDADALAFVLRTEVVVVETASAERRAIDRAKTLFALVATLPGMDRLIASESFDVAPLLAEVRAIMRIEETLASGGGFPALRRRGDLTAAWAVIPDDLIRELAIIGPLPVVRAKLAALAALGVTHVGVAPPAEATSAEAWRRLLEDLTVP